MADFFSRSQRPAGIALAAPGRGRRMTEQEILQRYSTPSLRRNELTRAGKKWHLHDMRKKYGWSADDIEKILDELYPPASADRENRND